MRKIVTVCGTMGLYLCAAVFGILPVELSFAKLALTKENPILVDEKEKTVSVLAQVNGKYFYQTTRHGLVYSGGSNGDKSVFKSFANEQDFYNALVKLGSKAGNNMTPKNAANTFVEGDLLDVTVTWEGAGKEYRMDEVITDSNKRSFQIRFGGNQKRALDIKTGCLLCLDSCPVGIVSNASYTNGAVEKRNEVVFKGNPKLLPPDGSLVVVTVKAHQ
ncbi:MAG: YdjY domain-containing protein [Desulfobacterales bacterium]|nr:YdjY domain-containing protein [Desulfobacterales bacterium]